MRRRRILGTVLPFSLVGCLRLTETDESTTEPAETPTPEPTESVAPGQTEENLTEKTPTEESEGETEGELEYPTGLSEDGVSPILADNHASSLRDESFVLELLNHAHHAAELKLVRVDPERAHVTVTGEAEIYYRDGRTEELWRQYHGGEQYYGMPNRDPSWSGIGIGSLVDHKTLRVLLDTVSYDNVSVEERDGEQVFRIAGDTLEDPERLEDGLYINRPTDASAEGYVTQKGIVRSLAVEVIYTEDESETLGEVRYEMGNIGNVTVLEPEWAETAEERAPELSAALSEDQTYVRIVHEGGQNLPPETLVDNTANEGDVVIGRELTDGDTHTSGRLTAKTGYLWIHLPRKVPSSTRESSKYVWNTNPT
ncbi:hypothetical protein RH858_08355 [Halalkaliarchaeum sp. AArc-GB]|uniref:hypothetical protein n=1 Tax=Halalkaliarchaeum sp. AArc-GB TaxID=3074078 RepID=UPI0028575344|nr:hypothetical protein [Halalkaliarchaeum sp. AArc-GB]MDR5673160.1 hypothetical protein [Halalkaliarchaeum sp. AArc-GB]